MDKISAQKRYNFDIMFVGYDWTQKNGIKLRLMKKINIKFISYIKEQKYIINNIRKLRKK